MIVINQKRYHRTGKGMSGYDMQAMLPKLKKQFPWLAEVNSQALQIVCHNLADAYNRFFKKKGGYPSFKKKTGNGSFACINNSHFEGSHIRLPKLGKIRYRGGDQPEGTIKKFTIRKQAGKFYASVLIDTPLQEPELRQPKKILGIDLGLNDVIVTSNGQAFPAPKFYRRAKRDLRHANKALARCKKGSSRRKKVRLHLARLHQKTANQRKDFNHKITRALVAERKNHAFAIESLAVKNMMRNHSLAGAIADAGWHQCLTFLRYKAAAVGKPVYEMDRWFPSSKTCSDCGLVRQSLPLSVREWTCDDCGSKHQRDVNAATNIALEAVRKIVFDSGGRVSPGVLRKASACEARRATAW